VSEQDTISLYLTAFQGIHRGKATSPLKREKSPNFLPRNRSRHRAPPWTRPDRHQDYRYL